MNATAEPAARAPRAGLKPALGAALITVATVALSIGFLNWRGHEQRRVLDARQAACEKGDAAACDALRSACVKRSADACVSLASAYFAPGKAHDDREGLRLLSDACVLHHGLSCLRAGRMYLEGTVTEKDLASARTMLDKGCDFGAHEACALRQTLE